MYHLIICLPDGKFSAKDYPSLEQRDEAAAAEQQKNIKVDQASDLDVLQEIELHDLYNFLAPKPMSVMKKKEWLTARIWSLLSSTAAPGEAFVKPAETSEETPPANQEEGQMASKSKAKATNKKPASKAAKATNKKSAKTNGHASPRGGSKTELVANLLKRKNGCTSAEVLEATGWPAVSMPAMAKACGLKLTKTKEKGERTRYRGE